MGLKFRKPKYTPGLDYGNDRYKRGGAADVQFASQDQSMKSLQVPSRTTINNNNYIITINKNFKGSGDCEKDSEVEQILKSRNPTQALMSEGDLLL